MTKKLLLQFPKNRVGDPLLYDLIKKYDLVVNIFRAKIDPDDIGYAVIDLTGTEEHIEQAFEFIKSKNIIVNDKMTGLKWDENKCTSCGACIPHCPTGALQFENRESMKMSFDDDKCIECLNCIDHCPFGACSSLFESK